ncbi:TetR/AcrR family transcriptional regulator [Gordonia paraffinivorans]|uniref:TetR/AcrR family transcriptional regulator n=1 Tax=Gordonia paraffinivorans TaxID=175628 RepID=UPI001447A1AE|nr:TetR/AcrR family transcriptional regulator [Gordonia paraffinivorans]
MPPADDARRLVRLLWRSGPEADARPRRGPKQRVSVDEIVDTAVDLADRNGLDAVSMRALATALGIGPMSLYTYVPSRDVLVALMIDRVAADHPMPEPATTPAESLAAIARALRDELLAHPWLLDAPPWRHVLGPNWLARYERQLEALESADIPDLDRDRILSVLTSFVVGNAREAVSARTAPSRSGMSDAEWWEAVAPELDAVIPDGAYPLANRVGSAAGELYQAPGAPAEVFEFGLARLLDGLRPLLGE